MRNVVAWGWVLCIVLSFETFAQVDTTYIYNPGTPYGTLDIRLARSATNYYYLQEGKTFSFRESAPGVKTESYRDMTSWDSSPYLQGNLREKKSETEDNFVMNYRLLLPQNYDPAYAKGYPIIIIFHGLGESGNCWEKVCHHADKNYSPLVNDPPAPTTIDSELLNNDHQLTNGGNVHLKARNDAGEKLPDDPTLPERAFPGLVLIPQNFNGWDGANAQDAIRIIRLLLKKYNIDDNRIYIHGLSNGGSGVYEAVKRAPWMFAATLTMSAINDAAINTQGMAPAIAHIPLWIFQGGQDVNPYPQKTENYIKLFRDAGSRVRYSRYESLGHGTWSTAYHEPDFFTWILGKNKATLHSFAGSTTICSAEGLKLELAAGFMAYQWQLNGTTIAGASGATYVATAPGTYRARFSRVANPSEAQWNQWSEPLTITSGTGLPQAIIKQHGTVLLRDLNNANEARLEAVGDFSHYYWYKDGALLGFPGDQDDTVKYAVIPATMGKGVYTLVTSNFDNCKSPVSAGKYLFFNNSAPTNIIAPTALNGTVNSASEITLTWNDASTNEMGFEIWRRRKVEATTFTSWEMATLTAASAATFKDIGLQPSSVYQYKIRAVSNTGRSAYTPADVNTFLELTTLPDTQGPTAPTELVARATGVKTVTLNWKPSTDDTGIREYVIVYGSDSVLTKTTDTIYVLKDLALNTIFPFRVKAIDLAGNRSAPSNEYKANTFVSGLYYEHSTGATFDLDSIDWSTPEFTGMVTTFTLEPKTQMDYFNFRFDGYLFITSAGTYTFRTTSDDGSRLKIDNAVVVDNDGPHDLQTVTSAVQSLTAGEHRITVDFFDYIESDSLRVEYMGPDTNNSWTTIPITALKSSEHIITGIEADNGPEDSFILSVYPNPSAQHNINVRIQTVVNSPVGIELLDPVGRRLLATMFEPDEVREGVKLSPEGVLTPGMYIVSAHQGKMVVRQKVIIR